MHIVYVYRSFYIRNPVSFYIVFAPQRLQRGNREDFLQWLDLRRRQSEEVLLDDAPLSLALYIYIYSYLFIYR